MYDITLDILLFIDNVILSAESEQGCDGKQNLQDHNIKITNEKYKTMGFFGN